MLLNQNLVDRERIELSLKACKAPVLPLSLTAQIIDNLSFYTPSIKASFLVSLPGFEPGPHDPKSRMQPDNTLER